MGKRVLQSDGKYCYTENCRVHDRSGLIGAGVDNIVKNVDNQNFQEILVDFKDILNNSPLSFNGLEVSELADRLINGEKFGARGFAFDNALGIDGVVDEEAFMEYFESYKDVEINLINSFVNKSAVVPGDRVMVRDTGVVAEVAEGSSLFGGRIRLNGEGNFDWFEPNNIVKLPEPVESLPVREYVLYSKSDQGIYREDFSRLFEEEVNTDIRNPQGLVGVGADEVDAVKAEFKEISQRVSQSPRSVYFKSGMVKFVEAEINKNRSWLSPAAELDVKRGLSNILLYLK